ncbi:hypothetical protein [Streptomyces platensis]|uniref:hypothetical protein n=1 Tax=Streptomyces platensis TaxID=58346 RepID=UPI002E8018EA|nr:hypothetical protein [Streptomyces platensis]WUB82338.1 hypothetical protein OG424_26010 [Streptomyces platensis]
MVIDSKDIQQLQSYQRQTTQVGLVAWRIGCRSRAQPFGLADCYGKFPVWLAEGPLVSDIHELSQQTTHSFGPAKDIGRRVDEATIGTPARDPQELAEASPTLFSATAPGDPHWTIAEGSVQVVVDSLFTDERVVQGCDGRMDSCGWSGPGRLDVQMPTMAPRKLTDAVDR